MTDLLLLSILWGLCSALIGVGTVDVFGADDTPLNFFFRWASRWQDKGGWRSWVTSPIGGCAICTSGQIALWSFSMVIPWARGLSTWLHIVAACAALTFAVILHAMHTWLKNRI